jgi:hypothetical protein
LKDHNVIDRTLRDFLISCGIAILLTLVVFGLTTFPEFRFLSYLVAPGFIFGMNFFPEGVHSDLAVVWIVFGIILDVLFLGTAVFGIWKASEPLIKRLRRS